MPMPLKHPNDCLAIKEEIDTNTSLPHKFFITMTWEPEMISSMKNKLKTADQSKMKLVDAETAPLEAWKINQFHHYLIRLAEATNSHLQAYGGLNPEWEHHHFHAILLSEKKIQLNAIKDIWNYCVPAAKNAKHYDPTKFAVPYIFTRHYGIPTRKTYCPGIKNSCRNGNCEHQGGNLLQRSA